MYKISNTMGRYCTPGEERMTIIIVVIIIWRTVSVLRNGSFETIKTIYK